MALTRKESTTLLAGCGDEYHGACLRAASAAHVDDWLLALPLMACVLRLDDETIRIVACLRLGRGPVSPIYALVEGWSWQTVHTVCLVVSVQADTPATCI